jgi:hypothetical protein
MRKVKALALAAVIVAAGAGMAGAAEQSGIGLQWGIGPAFTFGPFDTKMSDSFAVTWDVSENVSVAIIRQAGQMSGVHEYTDDVTLPGDNNITRRLRVDAYETINAIGISTRIPALSFLKVGMELGVISIAEEQVNYTNSDGSVSSVVNFGNVRDTLDVTGGLMGLTAKISLLKAETKTINSEIGVLAALRFVQIPTTRAFGIQETTVDSALHPVKKEIEALHSINSLDLKLAASLSF